jgi:hypothetical protein
MGAPASVNIGTWTSGLRRAALLIASLCLFAAASHADDQVAGQDPKLPKCLDETSAHKLLDLTGGALHRPLLPTTELMGAGTRSKVVLLGPLEIDHPADLYLKAYYYDPNDLSLDAVGGDARLIALSLTEADQKPIAEHLHISQTGNYLLQVEVPPEASTSFFLQKRTLLVIACAANSPSPLPVFWADAPVTVASVEAPIVGGIITVATLYLFCCGVVFLSRRRLIRQGDAAAARTPADVPKPRTGPIANRILWWILRLFGRLDLYPYLVATDGKAVPGSALGDAASTPVYRTTKVRIWPWYRYLDPVAISSDLFDRANLSNLQILFFSLLVCYGLTYIVLSTGEISGISYTVVELLGVTGIGSVAAKAIGTSRNRLSAQNWSWLVSRKVLPINDPGKNTPRWSDLVMSESELNLYKLQALAFSVIVGLGLIMSGFELATFSVPQELLEILLSSQLIFVAGGLAAPAAVGELDKLLDDLRAREDALRVAAATGKDVDSTGTPTDKPVDGKPVATFAEARKAVPNAANRYLQTANQAKIMLESIAHRDVDSTHLENPPLSGEA